MPHSMHSTHDAESSTLEPIAIVGMACRLPGGVDSASSLWEMLVHKKSGQTPKVPASRFNVDAHIHENLERPGSFNVLGGYFLDGPVQNFDPSFFNVTPIEAMWMDPQQRKMLEVSYECFESAGVTLDAVSGTNTAVFVGSFTSDYQQMSIRDTDFRHNYAATGVDPGIISNRIGNTFNLKGPSFTINTACSSSVYAIHNACHALRARDCTAALAGGVNLIITVDQHMNTAKLGILSPTSTCHTFDASADGYGRAEGAGALYLKLLSDAIRDGDPVRGVIRSSAVNTNGKVLGMGITHPSVKGQERVMRAAYERANLDPSKTAYLEMHGTGTPVGDPIETRAVANAMNDTRSKHSPLFVGAIKANIGHSEAASGIFAVMKAAMMTEAGTVPGVAGFKKLNPAIDEEGWNVKVHSETKPWPMGFSVKRASVNSFGYGGTNGHVVVEAIDSLYPSYWHGKAKAEAPYDHSASRPFLVGFSAHDKTTLTRNIEAHAKVADKFYLADLAYTLNSRRSKFNHKAFSIVTESDEIKFPLPSFKFGSAPKQVPEVGFIFTGQGAQWARMGIEAMQTFPPFLGTIKALDIVLQKLESPPSWTLQEALLAPAETSRVGEAEISQPVCTAIQIALVDLFAEWNILAAVTIGHSSGEIGAAYAAGLISAPEAILAAFYRGYAVKHNAPSGSMLAVGVGVQEISEYISGFGEDVVVACQNSSSSVTLSGTAAGIHKTKDRLDADKVFARELHTGKAYHSPQMIAVADAYEQLFTRALQSLDQEDLDWRYPRARMISSVTGVNINQDSLSPHYWCENLRSRVLFDSAVATMGKTPGLENVKCILEIGPHSALAGPFKQICKSNGFNGFAYIPTFVRNADSTVQLLKTAGELFMLNYPVDLERVNAVDERTTNTGIPKFGSPALLVDLPPYQWNYEKTYWAEPRLSQAQRFPDFGRHDLLGSKIGGLSDRSLVWRNMLRHKDVPWLKDHSIGGSAVFPAAGHLSMAIEALRQVCEVQNIEPTGMKFRDVEIRIALVIPDTDDGIEVQLRLQQSSKTAYGNEGAVAWYSFAVESITDDRWTTHCEGMVAADHTLQSSTFANSSPVTLAKLTQHVPGKRWYDAFHRVGFNYERSFQGLNNIRTDSRHHEAAADVEIVTESGLMTGESRYILHPSTIDTCLQLIIVSINAGLHKQMPHGVVPIRIEEVSLWFPGEDVALKGQAMAWTDELSGRYFNTNTQLKGKSGNVVLDIKNLRCVAYEAAVPQRASAERKREPYMGVVWRPDITRLKSDQAIQNFAKDVTESELVCELLELLNHKSSLRSVLLLGENSPTFVEALLAVASPTTFFTIGDDSSERLEVFESMIDRDHRVAIKVVPNTGLPGWDQSLLDGQDLVIVGKSFVDAGAHEEFSSIIKAFATSGGKAIFLTSSRLGDLFAKVLPSHGYAQPDLRFDRPESTIFLSRPQAVHTNGKIHSQEVTTVLSLGQPEFMFKEVISQLAVEQWRLQTKDLCAFDATIDTKLIIDDVQGTLLSSLNSESFDCLKRALCSGFPVLWLTAGVNEGKCVGGAMGIGLLRAIRSENAMAKITTLDVDVGLGGAIVGNIITELLGNIDGENSGTETEFWLHDGSLQISRVVPNHDLNDRFSASSKSIETIPLPCRQVLKGAFAKGELIFSQASPSGRTELAEDEVELQVDASEVDTTDVQAQSERPQIATGKIVEVGKGLHPSLLGREIVIYTNQAYSTVVRIPYVHNCFFEMSCQDLVATLPSLCKVLNAVVDTGKVRKDEHVLLLPAPITFVNTFIKVCKIVGFSFTIAVESEKDKDGYSGLGVPSSSLLLVSQGDAASIVHSLNSGKGPDVVIAHEFSPLSQEIWRFVPPMTRFILTDGTISETPDVLPFTRGAAFLSTSIAMLYKRDKTALDNVLKRALGYVKEHKDMLMTQFAVYDIGSFENAIKTSKTSISLGDDVLAYQYGKSSIKFRQSTELTFSPDAMYLLVGCLGGLGRSLTAWMMARGAKNFAFISRSGTEKAEAAHLVESMKNEGASVDVYRADASNEKDVLEVVSKASAVRPILGVVHAAMVLNDSLFERMTYDQFTCTIVPKVEGAKNLHKALIGHKLDFFVMTSSISATLGTPGQSNYCAANSFLDTLAWNCNLQGLPAVSLVLPMILDVGVVAENSTLEVSLSRKGIYGLDEAEMLKGFETAMMQLSPAAGSCISVADAQIILGLEPVFLAAAVATIDATDAIWYEDARFGNLRAMVEAAGEASTSDRGSGSDFMGQIKTAVGEGPSAVLQAIGLHITRKLSSILMIPVEDFVFDGCSVAEFGLDSMIGAELRNWLFKEFGLDISFQLLLAPTVSIKRLSVKVGVALGALDQVLEN